MTDGTTSAQPTFVAIVGDDGRFDHVRRRAVELAREAGGAVVLYDIDAGGSLLESPRPTQWSAEGEQEQFGPRLDVNDLEALGRAPLARQVLETRAEGVEAWAWLPEKDDADTLRDYLGKLAGARVLVPDDQQELVADLDARSAGVEVVAAR